MTLVYANIAISWQLLRFNSLKKHFPQIYRFENGLEKKFPDLKFFSLILAEKPVFPWFPWLEKVFKIFPEFPDFPDQWEPCLTVQLHQSGVNPVFTLLDLSGRSTTINPLVQVTFHASLLLVQSVRLYLSSLINQLDLLTPFDHRCQNEWLERATSINSVGRVL